MTEHILTAIYEEKGAAESAREDLLALGIDVGEVVVRSTSTIEDPALGTRFWGAEGAGLVPQADREIYDEALRRGGYLVVAQVPEQLLERACDFLEHLNPVDLDLRVQDWRASGWTGTTTVGEPALAHPAAPNDPTRAGALGESIAYAAEPGGHGTVVRRVRSYRRPRTGG
jgi:hypothetical protein